MNQIVELADLVGEPLTSVCFVMDYLELAFEESRVQCLAETRIIVAARTWAFPEAGSRDALCSLIGHPLLDVDVHEGELARFNFGSHGEVTVDLSYHSPDVYDAMIFSPGPDKFPRVW